MRRNGLHTDLVEKLRVDDELHRSIRVEDRAGTAATVPLEEALILDTAEQRRKLILSVLTEDPVQYYDLLQQARMNDDSEVVHYAATAMAQISKQADLALQQDARRFADDPNDREVLAAYANALERSLKLGLAQGRAAELQRHDDAAAHRTAEGRARGEGAFEDQPERLADERPVANEDVDAAQDVRDAHDGHELLADAGDGSQAAHDDEQGATAHDGSDDPGLHAEVRLRNRGDGAGLHGRSNSEDGEARHDGEPDGHELRPPRHGAVGALVALLPHVHSTAHHLAAPIFHTIFHGSKNLGIFGGHT